MTSLLLITDIPRLRKIFSRCFAETDFHLRIASSLERGGEEISADKPAMVFVQTHLSGLSADILLKHLKKQLGRKRSRFVLLSPPEQVSGEVLAQYQGHLDTSLDDTSLSEAIRETIAGLGGKGKAGNRATEAPATAPAAPATDAAAAGEQLQPPTPDQPAPLPLVLPQLPAEGEPSLEEQGLTYTPRQRVSVYSEFTSSFDSAVSTMQPAEPAGDTQAPPPHDWDYGQIETVEPGAARPKRITFLLWLAPVLVAVIIVTLLQHRRPRPATTVEITPAKPAASPRTPATPPAPAGMKPSAATVPSVPAKPGGQPPATGTEAQMSDRAVMSAIAENRPPKVAPGGTRLTELPDFIPRAGFDKQYGAANPGWERYRGHSTEFKVFREKGSIKAIQVIDRGGKGVPESFMKAVMKQVSKNPVFVPGASEKKEGYEIQRGQLADNTVKVVYYRDEQGGTIRAFVLTWQ